MLTDIPPAAFALALPDDTPARLLWGLGRQLALLVLPVAAPLLLWLSLHGPFLRQLTGGRWQRLNTAATGADQPS